MATQVKFFRGSRQNYLDNLSKYTNGIYFAQDTAQLYLDGASYGVAPEDLVKLENSVSGVSYANNTLTITYTGEKQASTISLPLASADVDGLMSKADKAAFDILNGTGDGSVKKQVADALQSAKDYADSLDTAMDTRVDILESMVGLGDSEGSSLSEKVSANATAIQKNADAIADIEADYLKAADKTELSSAITKEVSDRETAISGLKTELLGEVADSDAKTIAALNDKIEEVKAAAKTYEIVPVTEGLAANVREAWKLVDEDGNQVGATINNYKDSSLKDVELVEQELKFTYILADGSESTVGVDVSNFLAESEFGNGLVVSELDGTVAIKIDTTSESFLTVGANGIKLAGVQDAINAAETAAKGHANDINAAMNARVEELEEAIGEGGSVDSQISEAIDALDATVGEAEVASGKHVAVQVVEEDGKITAVNVKESDIASAKELADYKTSNDTAVQNAASAAAAAQSYAEGVAGDLADYETANDARVKTVEDSLAENGSVGSKVKANTDAIAVLTGTEEGSVKKAVADAKTAIEAYTVQGKAISTNPTFNATEIKVGSHTTTDGQVTTITGESSIAEAIQQLEDAWNWHEEA